MEATRSIEFKSVSAITRGILIGVGTLFVGLGIVGAFLPVLPTTPFMLIAAACYVRSSEKLYNRLLSSPFVGDHFHSLLEGRGLTLRVKLSVMAAAGVVIAASILMLQSTALRLLMFGLWAAQFVYFVFVLKTAEPI